MNVNESCLIDDINPAICVNGRLRRVTRLVNRLYSRHLRAVGISSGQQTILFFVGKVKAIEQREIGKRLQLERSTVTRELNGLVEKGYVIKSEGSQRPVIELTSEGARFLNKMVPIWQDAQNEALELLGREGDEALNTLLVNTKA
ncbi:MarR family winged helix-turn-helix transcriptional regulator [Rapidithrix thailandica]|uniref:MarR family winged helix-turn-helix transcriptional regulator n=1 Tax=Rapidithrix thailandica TaxID=413964 RepID=A0AAW9S5C5_9BACT